MEMIRILLVVDAIGQDGTGRFVTHLANGLSEHNGFDVTLLTLHEENGAFNNDLAKGVKVEKLQLQGRIRFSLGLITNKIVEIEPQICFILYTQLIFLSVLSPYLRLKGIKIYFRETIIPSLYRKQLNGIHKFLIRRAYNMYDGIVAQSIDMAYDLVEKWGCKREKITVINNLVRLDVIQERIKNAVIPDDLIKSDKPVFISAGRLAPQKGYDIIIQRISEMKPDIPFKYFILGDGDEKEKLEKMISESGLEESVFLLGFKTNPYSYIYYSDALILSSRYEGFPNIVLEAMALGKPVFSNQCLGGINEIIINGKNGVSCDFGDKDSFFKGLNKFMSTIFDPAEIVESVNTRYSKSIIMKKYADFFYNEMA